MTSSSSNSPNSSPRSQQTSSSSASSTASPSASPKCPPKVTKNRYQPYSKRYKRKRVQNTCNSLFDHQTTRDTEPTSERLSVFEESSSDDDFHSCIDFNDPDRLSDFSPESPDSEDVSFDEEVDILIQNILLRDVDDEGEDGTQEPDVDDERPTFRQLFSVWVTFWGICQNAVEDLLSIFRRQPWGIDLPKTCRALLKTPRLVTAKDVSPGNYHYTHRCYMVVEGKKFTGSGCTS